jgi:hypothetical protein
VQYADLTAALAFYSQNEQPSAAYTGALPTIISKAELRIYRDLDLAATHGVNSSLVFTPSSRVLSLTNMSGQTIDGLPVAFPYPITVEGLTAIVPAWRSPPYGTRVRFLPVSLAFIDMTWPQESVVSVPGVPFAYFAMLDDETLVVAPTPDLQYTVEVFGTWRPAPMSASNPSSWIGDHVYDLLVDACMIEIAGWMRDFGQQADDPRMAVSWEQRYQQDLTSARNEEVRRTFGRPVPIQFPMVPMGAPPGPRGGPA